MSNDKTLAAVRQACAEELSSVHSTLRDVLSKRVSDEVCVRYGALTPRIAVILDEPLPRVRRRLQAMHKRGELLRHMPYQSTVRWWPVGYAAETLKRGGA